MNYARCRAYNKDKIPGITADRGNSDRISQIAGGERQNK